MHRLDTQTAVSVLPSPESQGSPGFFSKGDAVGGVPASIPGPDWFNMVQEELVATLIALGGELDQSKSDYGQLADVIVGYFALKHGDSTNIFKVAEAVNPEDAVRFSQLSNLTDNIFCNSDQSWQDVTGSRSVGVTYTNTSGSPIMVNIVVSSLSPSTGYMFAVDGVTIARMQTASGNAELQFCSTVIPPDSTYVLTVTNASLVIWAELR